MSISVDDYFAMRDERDAYWHRLQDGLEANPELMLRLTSVPEWEDLVRWEEIR